MSFDGARVAESLQARGTLARELVVTHPLPARRLRLLLELGLAFIVMPLLIRYVIFEMKVPLPVVLQPVLLGLVLYLLWDPTFRVRRELGSGFAPRELANMLLLFVAAGGLISLFVYLQMAQYFLSLPTYRPRVWALVMLLYPVMSVIPQELVYRTFFFHRYGPLFGDARWLAIVVNGVLFGFAHVIFGNYTSILLTAILGVLLAWRYERTRSFWAVWFEHSLYGCLIFTIGLGHYFFTGVSN